MLSASQDVVVDAYRTDLLPASERGIGSSLTVLGYRLAMILSGGIAFIWVDPRQGGGWTWPQVYRLMALLMVGAAVFSALCCRGCARRRRRRACAPRRARLRRRARGGRARLRASTRYALRRSPGRRRAAVRGEQRRAARCGQRWADLVALVARHRVDGAAGRAGRRARARFETFLGGLANYFAQPGAAAFLAFIVLYKLGDAFAGSLMTPFLLQAMHFSTAEVGVVNKVIGLWLTIGGALLGGALMLRLGLWRALLLFGVLQMAGQPRLLVARGATGRGALPGLVDPALRLGLRQAGRRRRRSTAAC